jgi:divalent metal cation (Fe/Co/Zn/Cd) transporter
MSLRRLEDYPTDCEHHTRLSRQALLLSYFTVGYNMLEGALSLLAGGLASSIALVGFGLDSFTESASGAIMIWRFRQTRLSASQEQKLEAKAVRLVGWSFFGLAAYVLIEAARKLITADVPEPSLLGIIIASASLVVMPALFIAKQVTGRRMGSRSLLADSKQTLACTFMSAALLIGLVANRRFGCWQADPVVGFLIGAWLVREGVQTLRAGRLCSC